MLTLLIISKKSKPLLVTAEVAQMSQKQNAFAMPGRGKPSLCAGTWRSEPAPALRKHIVPNGVWQWESSAHAELVQRTKDGINLFVVVQIAKEFHTWFAEQKTAASAPCLSLLVAPQFNCSVSLICQQDQALALRN